MKIKKIINNINLKTSLKFIYNKFKNKFKNAFIIKKKKISNLVLINNINKKIDLLFLGHVDVVSEGDMCLWEFFPYSLKLINNKMYARGVCDMKGAICAFLNQINKINIKKNFAIVISGDEEGKAKYGCRIVSKFFIKKKIFIKNCIVGEPTSENRIGDVVKTGRRGSLNFKLTIIGSQFHTAYKGKKNPIIISSDFINKIERFNFVKSFSIQITKIISLSKEENSTPNFCFIYFNIRFNKIKNYNFFLRYLLFFLKKINFSLFKISQTLPFESKGTSFLKKIKTNFKIKNYKGGTSDGRFLNKISKNLIELGLKNKFIHKINENINAKDYLLLERIYLKLIIEINS